MIVDESPEFPLGHGVLRTTSYPPCIPIATKLKAGLRLHDPGLLESSAHGPQNVIFRP